MSDIHALSGAYAVDALDDHERHQFEQHLAACSVCQAEVSGLREALALLPETTPVAPPPSLRDRVLAGIGTVRPLPPLPVQETMPAPVDIRSRRRRFPVGLAAAAAMIAVLGGTAVVTQPWDDSPSQGPGNGTAADAVLTAADAKEVSVNLGGAKATIVRSVSQRAAVIVTEDMPAAPDGKLYELWLQRPEGNMVPAGLMPTGSDNTVLLEGDAAEAIGAGITVEPAPDGSNIPTTKPIALFDFEQAT
jgi:anti-sigma-K factor RskA